MDSIGHAVEGNDGDGKKAWKTLALGYIPCASVAGSE